MLAIKNFLKIYFLGVVFIFSLASSYYLYGGNVKLGLFPELYYIKHASLVILSILGIIFFIAYGKYKLNKVFILIIPYMFYLGVNSGIVFIQFIFFLIAATLISYIYNVRNFVDKKTILMFLLAISIVPLIDYLFDSGNFLFNSYYGRERLLLGYFHPKEAGLMFVSLFVMVMLSKTFKNSFSKLLFYILSLSLLYFIQSRNSLLFIINLLVFNSLVNRFGLKISLILYFIVYIIIPSFIIYYYFDNIDFLMSNRLSVWLDGFRFNLFGLSLEFSDNLNRVLYSSKFHIDNFYLEFLIEAGLIALLLLIVCLIYIGYKIRNIIINGYRVISIYIAFLILCFFDAGMFSTGNFLNVFIWSIIIFSIREKRNLLENNIR